MKYSIKFKRKILSKLVFYFFQVSDNKIVFLNAFKMKVSIILGVIHMTFGVLLSYGNATYFKRPLNVMAEFIPQIIFLGMISN